LRYDLVEAANSVRQHCPEYGQYYAAKKAETPRHAHKRALVLTARKLVRLIDALLRTQARYQPPAERQLRTGTAPHAARPRPPRRYKRASAVEEAAVRAPARGGSAVGGLPVPCLLPGPPAGRCGGVRQGERCDHPRPRRAQTRGRGPASGHAGAPPRPTGSTVQPERA
jgi:hypothetical protein